MSGAVITSWCLLLLAPSHALPENHIECGVEVLVFPERIEVRYHVGLTDRQAAIELDFLEPSGDRLNDAVAVESYRKLTAPLIAKRLAVSVNGQPQDVVLRGSERFDRHHVRFVVVCDVAVPLSDEPARIEVRDEMPRGKADLECRRMALRGRRGVQVIESSGEANLVRVPRQRRPASDFTPGDPSRTIVAVCRLAAGPAAQVAMTDGADTEGPREEHGDRSETDDQPARTTRSPDTVAAPTGRTPMQMWLVVAGLFLITVGCLLAIPLIRQRQSNGGG